MAQTHRTGRAPVHELFPAGTDATVENTVSANTFSPQMIADESGAIQIDINQLIGGGQLGAVVVEGRLHPDALFAEIFKVEWDDLGGSGILTIAKASVPMVKEMRLALRDTGAGYSVLASTTLTAWIME